jgi:RND family efflux transporter MFP subunit
MIKYLFLLLPLLGWAEQITLAHAQIKPLGKIIQTNAEITQLSDQKQKIVSRLPGHVEAYYVKAGEDVKKGDKVALVESIQLSTMTAEYMALKQQAKAARTQLATAKKLYKKGLNSQNELNQNIIDIENVLAKQSALESQMQSLGINVKALTGATDQFILYAHADGVVGEIFIPLHSNVDAEDSLMSIVKQNAYYTIAYLGLEDAMKVNVKTTGFVTVADKKYPAHFVQLLPTIDEETQRAKVLFKIENSPKNLLLGTYVEMEISLAPYRDALMVNKSALTLFQGEWVVFVEAEHEEKNEAHDQVADQSQDEHNKHNKHDEHEKETP